ncbi:septum formation initiator family protein [Homoserinibacter sp. GY 40078]|nr:septum formation initiator family protein [Homoserinibacter sp. GY 40078]
MAEPSRGALWLRNFRLSGFALTVLLLIVAALVVLAPRFKTLVEQRQQIAQLEQEVANAQDRLDELDAEVARWSDPAYVEAQARDRLYYVFPGDTSYLVIDDAEDAATDDDQPISDTIQSTQVDWMDALLASVYTAGLTDATPEQLDSPTQIDSPDESGGSDESGDGDEG